MATTTDVLRILLTGDSRGLVQAFKDAQGASEKFQVAGRALTAGVTVPLVGLGVAAVGAAADLEAAGSKVDQVFGDSADEVRAFAETTTDAYGISERAALQAAGTFGNLFVTMGLGTDAAADMSSELLALTGDLAAFHDIAREDVLEKLRAGLVGEIEPLRSLGVNFDAATVSAGAMALAVANGRTEITEADKVAARFNLIMEQTAIAQGQAARESETLQSQQARTRAELENSAAAIGESLLPAATEAAAIVADLAGAFQTLPEPVQGAIVKFGLVAAAAGPVALLVGKLVTVTKALAVGIFTELLPRIGMMRGRLVALGAGLGVASAAIAVFMIHMQQAKQKAAELEAAVTELGAAVEQAGSREAGFADWFADSPEFVALLAEAGMSIEEAAAAAAGGEEAIRAFGDEMLRNGATFGETQMLINQLVRVTGEFTQRQTNLATATQQARNQQELAARAAASLGVETEGAADATSDYANQQELAAAAAGSLAESIDEVLDRYDELQGETLAVTDATADFYEAVDEAVYLIGRDGFVASLDLATAAGRENQRALDDLAVSALDTAQAVSAAGGSQEEINFAMAVGRDAFIATAQAMGVSADEANRMADEMALIPDHVPVTVDVSSNVWATNTAIDYAARNRTAYIDVRATSTGRIGGVPLMAEGGPVRAGSPYIVGDAGPELFVPNMSGTIVPNHELVGAGARSVGGGMTVNIMMPPGADGEDVVAAIERYKRRGGHF